MRRRTFTKALLFTVPPLCSSPFPCQSFGSEIVKEQKQEFVIFFIGDHGRRVGGEFKCLKRQYPIPNQCRHITMNVLSEAGLMELPDNFDHVEILSRFLNCEVACFVLDTRDPESLAWAELISDVFKQRSQATLMCLSPVISNNLKRDFFNLTIETLAKDQDLTAGTLLTLYNTYLGCGLMGCFQCLKLLFDSMELDKKHLRAKAGVAIQKGTMDQIDPGKLVLEANPQCQNPGDMDIAYLGILEMNPSEDKALVLYQEVYSGINEQMGTQDNAVILHLGLTREEAKLTIFGICPEGG